MGNLKYLLWALAKFVDLTLDTHFFYGVGDLLDVHHSFVGHIIENCIIV